MSKIPHRNSESYKAYRREYSRKYYREKYRTKQIENNLRYRQQNQQWFQDYKSTLKCSRCPEDHPACLDFHHRDGKSFLISKGPSMGRSKKAMLAEIAKCEVLCSNCHRKLHALK